MLSRPPYSYLETLNKVDAAIDANAKIAEAILSSAIESMGLAALLSTNPSERVQDPPWHNTARKIDLDKVRSTVHQLYRDWSAEGNVEREACYGPVLDDLAETHPTDRSHVRVLVPGAGLGRLVLELCHSGYQAEGNEISYHQLLTSSFILNHTERPQQWPLYPFALSFSNVRRREDQLRRVMIPDVHPGTYASGAGSMSMTTGDFCDLYSSGEYSEHFDAIATVFFIDTSANVIAYIETVRRCLKPGGLWINVGPLLWHFGGRNGNETDDTEEKKQETGITGSFEPSADEILLLIQQAGFTITKRDETSLRTGYVQNTRSMLQSTYAPVHWVARKG